MKLRQSYFHTAREMYQESKRTPRSRVVCGSRYVRVSLWLASSFECSPCFWLHEVPSVSPVVTRRLSELEPWMAGPCRCVMQLLHIDKMPALCDLVRLLTYRLSQAASPDSGAATISLPIALLLSPRCLTCRFCSSCALLRRWWPVCADT